MTDSAPLAPAPGLIGLIGGESTGKTTLATALAERLSGIVTRDMLREHVAGGSALPGPGDQAARLRDQAEEVHRMRDRGAWVIADPMPLMTAVYSLVYFDDASLIPAGIADAADYDLVVWCSPDIPWTADPGMRDGPHRRAEAQAVIAEHVVDRLTGVVPVLTVAGPVATRIESVLRAVLRN